LLLLLLLLLLQESSVLRLTVTILAFTACGASFGITTIGDLPRHEKELDFVLSA
jgi:hypothetical protein